jgi:Helicase conserved C-terminal domain
MKETAVQIKADIKQRFVRLALAPQGEQKFPVGPASAKQRASTRLAEELRAVEAFAARALALPKDAKALCLVEAVGRVGELAAKGEGSGKVVIFTESLTTQDYLRRLLVDSGVRDHEITVFRGQNDSERAREALAVWERDVASRFARGAPSGRPPGPEVALRLALVHEFRTRSRIFLSTEAGAKRLNLQFCETLINYDLPWNPQRIEQRIGRVHRYGQTHDVTVINFLAQDNDADRLLFEILSRKLELFGTVLDQSDVVLHEDSGTSPALLASAIGFDLQAEIGRIYDTSHSVAEVNDRLKTLGRNLEARREGLDDEQARVGDLIETRLDGTVRQVFRHYQDRLPSELAELMTEPTSCANRSGRHRSFFLSCMGCGATITHGGKAIWPERRVNN